MNKYVFKKYFTVPHYLKILAAENRPSEISMGSQVSHSSRGNEAEFAFFDISFCTFSS
jgi:hypothetical protein